MPNTLTLIITISVIFFVHSSWARNTIAAHSIEAALKNPIAEKKLSGVSFYFGNQKHQKPWKIYQEFKANNKTNAFAKEDEEACQIAFLSSLIELQKRAQQVGGNAVVNIHSTYMDKITISESDYQCGAGAIVAGVSLTGTVVSLED